jgi:hypothetical protein
MKGRTTLKPGFALLAACATGVGVLAVGSARAEPGALSAVLECRSITDPKARLACFDASTGIIASLVARKQVEVVDAETLRQTRRSLFGYYLPKIPLFSPDRPGEDVSEIDGTVASVRETSDGQVEIHLSDGAVWRTTEAPDWGAPKPGTTVHIRRGLIGAYFLTFKNQRPVRGMRVR